MRRFSKLKKRIESLFAPGLDLKVYCTVYQRPCYYGGTSDLPRFWIALNKEIIFDWLKDFKDIDIPEPAYYGGFRPVYYEDITFITDMIQEYIETPVNKLFDYVLCKDYYGLSEILKAADRRIGQKRLLLLRDRTKNEAAKKIIDARLANKKGACI
jgi:hypothetical protein